MHPKPEERHFPACSARSTGTYLGQVLSMDFGKQVSGMEAQCRIVYHKHSGKGKP